MKFLFFDTETTGLPLRSELLSNPSQPHVTQLGFILEINRTDAMVVDTLITPQNWTIGAKARELTGITEDMCYESGIPIADAVDLFMIAAENCDFIVCHNVAFDRKLMAIEHARLNAERNPYSVLCGKPTLCTMEKTTNILKLPKKDNRTNFKWPKLSECYQFFFNEELENAHSAIVDIQATRRVFNLLVDEGYFDEEFAAWEEAKALAA
ncbi:3'-5' exonuclease [Sphingobium sp. MK2]|uniref:3'-5' exonuclease n=1 Tax=Sphingobium sp. MK2 TaxID=3116540 RepID=UPI0032E35DDF